MRRAFSKFEAATEILLDAATIERVAGEILYRVAEQSARKLVHWLDGTGSPETVSLAWLRQSDAFREAERMLRDRAAAQVWNETIDMLQCGELSRAVTSIGGKVNGRGIAYEQFSAAVEIPPEIDVFGVLGRATILAYPDIKVSKFAGDLFLSGYVGFELTDYYNFDSHGTMDDWLRVVPVWMTGLLGTVLGRPMLLGLNRMQEIEKSGYAKPFPISGRWQATIVALPPFSNLLRDLSEEVAQALADFSRCGILQERELQLDVDEVFAWISDGEPAEPIDEPGWVGGGVFGGG